MGCIKKNIHVRTNQCLIAHNFRAIKNRDYLVMSLNEQECLANHAGNLDRKKNKKTENHI